MQNEIINLKEYLMGRDQDDRFKDQYTIDIKDNALILLNKVNGLLTEIGVDVVVVSSGWRPAAINAAIPTASKKSAHLIGKAVDIHDESQSLYNKIVSRPELLTKYGLWLEDSTSTPTWVHLDDKERPDRPLRVFKP